MGTDVTRINLGNPPSPLFLQKEPTQISENGTLIDILCIINNVW